MLITRQAVAVQIAACLRHEITPENLADRAETALMNAEFEEADCGIISEVVARLGLSDVRALGLAWEDCEELLRRSGFVRRVEVVAA